MRRATAAGRLLVASTVEHDWRTPPAGVVALAARAGAGRVVAGARFHGVVGCVHLSLGPVAPAPLAAALAADHARCVDAHVRALGDLAGLAPALEAAAVPWLVLKGPVLAEHHYARPDLRCATDLDVLVPGPRLGAALEAVASAGGEVLDTNWRLLRELGAGELLVRLRHGTLLDLHWRLFNEAPVRRALAVPLADVMGRSRAVRLGPVAAATLDPVDTVVHLGAHATLSGGNRLVWSKDLERVVATAPPAWDEVVGRARAWRAGPAVGLALARARALLGAAVPDGVPEALAGGRSFLRAGALVDRLAPPARSTGNRSVVRLVSRSARATSGASAAELGRRLAGAVVGRSRLSLAPPRADLDPDNPASVRHRAGTDEDRRAFLDAVAEEGW